MLKNGDSDEWKKFMAAYSLVVDLTQWTGDEGEGGGKNRRHSLSGEKMIWENLLIEGQLPSISYSSSADHGAVSLTVDCGGAAGVQLDSRRSLVTQPLKV